MPEAETSDRMEPSKSAPLKARQGACAVGFFDDDIVEEVKAEFTPVDLNEGNVQAIFNRCLAKADSKDFSYAALFPTAHGYEEDAEK